MIKKTSGGAIKNEIMSNEKLDAELHKPIIRKFNIWGTDLANMQLISKFNRIIRFLLCIIDIFSKYPWVISLKGKNGFS